MSESKEKKINMMEVLVAYNLHAKKTEKTKFFEIMAMNSISLPQPPKQMGEAKIDATLPNYCDDGQEKPFKFLPVISKEKYNEAKRKYQEEQIRK